MSEPWRFVVFSSVMCVPLSFAAIVLLLLMGRDEDSPPIEGKAVNQLWVVLWLVMNCASISYWMFHHCKIEF